MVVVDGAIEFDLAALGLPFFIRGRHDVCISYF